MWQSRVGRFGRAEFGDHFRIYPIMRVGSGGIQVYRPKSVLVSGLVEIAGSFCEKFQVWAVCSGWIRRSVPGFSDNAGWFRGNPGVSPKVGPRFRFGGNCGVVL